MKAGKTACIILLCSQTALAMLAVILAAQIDHSSGGFTFSQIMIMGGLVLTAFGLVLVPLGVSLDRSIARLQQYIDSANSSDASVEYGGPSWLRPITHAFTAAVDRFRQREIGYKTRLHEIEIRHLVSEADRRQVDSILHALRDAVIVTNTFDEIMKVNEAAAELFRFDVGKAAHKPLAELIPDETVRQLVRDTRESGNLNDQRHVEHEMLAFSHGAEGKDQRVFDVTLTCVENHKGESGGVITILRDTTRERELSQMKTDFVSKASHELRTPLSSIRAYVEMLLDGEAHDEAARQEFYNIIQNETDRLGRLIDNVLHIGRIEAGILQVERTKVDVTPLVERAISTLEPQAREKQITLRSKLSPIDLCIEGDGDMLFQVILNLISNAVKYTPDGGRVVVSADSDNLTRSIVVSVADTGLGIPPDALPRLFEKFYRVENYKRVAKGTGLGLNLCKQIIETVHHGQIGVESKLGMGSRFWFSVPMRYAGSRAA